MNHAMVSGASGFVGRELCALLGSRFATVALGSEDWRTRIDAAAFEGATVYHLAARVHRGGLQDEVAHLHDNEAKTRALAEAAVRKGARRLVFLSSIKVNGEETRDRAFRTDDPPNPQDAYARSKLAAERALREIAAGSGLEVVIVRSPLVYGRGARGNLRSLARLASSGLPLPFASLDNRRSFVHVADLARLLVACGANPAADGRLYLAAHAASISTRELVAALRRELSVPQRLFAMSPAMLETAAAIVGRREQMRRLTRSLEVDASAARHELGWDAQVSFDQAVRDVAGGPRPEDAR